MRYCCYCGKEVEDEAVVCVHCGRSITHNKPVKEDDKPSALWRVLGFLIPLLGLIMYLAWKDDQPLRAKSAGKGALVGLIVSIALPIVLYVVTVIIALAVA